MVSEARIYNNLRTFHTFAPISGLTQNVRCPTAPAAAESANANALHRNSEAAAGVTAFGRELLNCAV